MGVWCMQYMDTDQVVRYDNLGSEAVLVPGVGGAVETVVHPVRNVVLLVVDRVP